MTRRALLHLALAHGPGPVPDPDPEAAVTVAAPLALAVTGDAPPTGDVIGPHLHPAAVPHLAPGPALTLVATGLHPAVAVTTIADMAVAVTVAPRHDATGSILTPTVAHPHQTGTLTTGPTGLAPGLPAGGADTGGL